MESEPSDSYSISSDISLFSTDYVPLGKSFEEAFPVQLLDLLSRVADSVPFNMHYLLFYINTNDPLGGAYMAGDFQFYLLIFDDYEFNNFILTFPNDVYLYVFTIDQFSPFLVTYSAVTDGAKVRDVSVDLSYFELNYRTGGGAFSFHFHSVAVFSDLSKFDGVGMDLMRFIDISHRRERRVEYATLFSLAVFFLFDILRGFWRSACGRDT